MTKPPPDAIPSSAAFDLIHSSLTADPNEQTTAIKQGGAIFAFTIKNGGTTDSWHIDLKNKGVVGKGLAPEGQKATGSSYLYAHLWSYQRQTPAHLEELQR